MTNQADDSRPATKADLDAMVDRMTRSLTIQLGTMTGVGVLFFAVIVLGMLALKHG